MKLYICYMIGSWDTIYTYEAIDGTDLESNFDRLKNGWKCSYVAVVLYDDYLLYF